jgi:hypothetical protein
VIPSPATGRALCEEIAEIALAELDIATQYAGFSTIGEQAAQFSADPAWGPFSIGHPNFMRMRVIGNYYTAIFRKFGDLYQRVTETVIMRTLGLGEADLKYAFDISVDGGSQRRSLDIAIIPDRVADPSARERVTKFLSRINRAPTATAVLEVRACYMIGDSKRIQADEHAANSARRAGLMPVMLIYCTTSLRSPVDRLRRSWFLFEGQDTFDFVRSLTGFDLSACLNSHKARFRPAIDRVIKPFGIVLD